MKIPRYESGRSNVQALEGVRGAIRTPEQEAHFAGRKSRAFGEVAEIVGKQLSSWGQEQADERKRLDEINEHQLKVQDSLTDKNETAYYNAAIKNLETTAKMEKWTPEQFQAEMDILNENYLNTENIIGDNTRGLVNQNRQNIVKINQEATLVNMAALRMERNAEASMVNYYGNLAAENWDLAEVDLDDALAAGGIDEVGRAKELARVAALREGATVADKIAEIQELYYNDEEAGVAAYREVFEDEQMDEDVRNKILAGLPGAFGNVNRIKKIEEDRQQVSHMNWTNEAVLDISTSPTPRITSAEQAIEIWETGKGMEEGKGFGDPQDPASFGRLMQTIKALGDRYKSDVSAIQFSSNLKAAEEGTYVFEDDKANREEFDKHIATTTQGMEGAEKEEAVWSMIQAADMIPQSFVTNLQSGPKGADNMMRQIPLFMKLTSGEEDYDLHLTKEEEGDYLFVKSLVETATSDEEYRAAVDEWWQAKKNPLKATAEEWKDKGYDKIDDLYNQYIYESDFRPEGIIERIKDSTTAESWMSERLENELKWHYMKMAEIQFKIGATPEQAAWAGIQHIEKMGGIVKLNGRWETQLHAPRGKPDLTNIQTEIVQDLSGYNAGYIPIEGVSTPIDHYIIGNQSVPVDEFDPEKVELYIPFRKEEAYNDDGELVLQAYYDGLPLRAETEKGQTMVVFDVPLSDIGRNDTPEARQQQIDSLLDDITHWENEVKRLEKIEQRKEGQTRYSASHIYNSDSHQRLENARDSLKKATQVYWDNPAVQSMIQ